MSNAFSENLAKTSYQIQLYILYAIPVWLAVAVWFIPETPRWLMIKERESDARRSLLILRPKSTTKQIIEGELAEIRNALLLERRLSSEVMWRDVWRGRDLVSLSQLIGDHKSDL